MKEKVHIYHMASQRVGCHFKPCSTSVLSPMRNFEALRKASRWEVYKGSGTDNYRPRPLADLSRAQIARGLKTHGHSYRSAIESLLRSYRVLYGYDFHLH